jgi:hypothetical protein
MKVRLIKPSISSPEQPRDEPPREVPIIDTIQSWVREFHRKRADRNRLDFEQISNAGKT